jgi:hypothetical protein
MAATGSRDVIGVNVVPRNGVRAVVAKSAARACVSQNERTGNWNWVFETR